jgi:hypothetical protein
MEQAFSRSLEVASMTNKVGLVLAGLIVLAGVGLVRAEPITYTTSAMGSGSLGGVNFTNALMTIALVGDTNAVMMTSPGFWQVLDISGTVTVAGVGTGTFIIPVGTFDNQNVSVAGNQSRGTGEPDILDVSNPAFLSYDLRTSIGPLSGTPLFNPSIPFPTTSGNFNINSVAGMSTFEATTGPAVPEPSALALSVVGLASLAFISCRRRNQA